MMHHKILNEEEFFWWILCRLLSVTVQATYVLVSQKMIVLHNIVLIQTVWILDQQRDKKNLSDWFWYRKWNETNGAVLENAAFAYAEEGTEVNM